MELEIKLNTWKYLNEQMSVCEKNLSNNEQRLEEWLYELRKHSQNEEMEIIRRKIKCYKEVLREQKKNIGTMALALERVGEYYSSCEEQIIEVGEADSRRFVEEIKRMDLNEWHTMPVLLKR